LKERKVGRNTETEEGRLNGEKRKKCDENARK
jgi:hypothetical protein